MTHLTKPGERPRFHAPPSRQVGGRAAAAGELLTAAGDALRLSSQRPAVVKPIS